MNSTKFFLFFGILFILGCSLITPSPNPIDSNIVEMPPEVARFGPMETHQTPKYHFAFEYPANWEDVAGQSQLCQQAPECYQSHENQVLTIWESDIGDVGKPGMMTLEEYLDLLMPTFGENIPGFELLSRKPLTIASGLSGEVIEFTFQNGVVKARLLQAVFDGKLIEITYFAFADEYDQLSPLVEYSFSTLRVLEPE